MSQLEKTQPKEPDFTGNLYEILGVNKDADKATIKKAFKRLANKHHPDKSGGNETYFKLILEAYEVLSDPARRKKYDESGDTRKTNLNELARNMLADLFSKILQGGSHDYQSILKSVEDILNNSEREIKNEVKRLTNTKKDLNKKIKRITVKNGNNLYAGVIEQQLLTINNQVNGLTERLEIMDLVRILLISYDENIPERPEEPEHNSSGHTIYFSFPT